MNTSQSLFIVYQDIADVDNLYSLLLIAKNLKISPRNPLLLVLMPRLVNFSAVPLRKEDFSPALICPPETSSDSYSDSELLFRDSAVRVWQYIHTSLHTSHSMRYTMDSVLIFRGDYPINSFSQLTPSLAPINHAVHAHDYVFFRRDLFGGEYGDVISPDEYQTWLQNLRSDTKRCETIRTEIESGFQKFESLHGIKFHTFIYPLKDLHHKLTVVDKNVIIVLLAQATSCVKFLSEPSLLRKVRCVYGQFFTWSSEENILGAQFNIALDRISAEKCVRLIRESNIPFYCVTTQYPNNGSAPKEFVRRAELGRGKLCDSGMFFSLRDLWNGVKGNRPQGIFDIWTVALIFNFSHFKLVPISVEVSDGKFHIQVDRTRDSRIFAAVDSSQRSEDKLCDWMLEHIFS